MSVSISASLPTIGSADWDALEECWTVWSDSEAADVAVDPNELFTSSMSRCTRDLQTDIAFSQKGIACSGFEPISKQRHIRKFLGSC